MKRLLTLVGGDGGSRKGGERGCAGEMVGVLASGQLLMRGRKLRNEADIFWSRSRGFKNAWLDFSNYKNLDLVGKIPSRAAMLLLDLT